MRVSAISTNRRDMKGFKEYDGWSENKKRMAKCGSWRRHLPALSRDPILYPTLNPQLERCKHAIADGGKRGYP